MTDELTFPRPDGLTDEEWAQLTLDIEAYADQQHARALAARAFHPHVVKHDSKGGRDSVTDCPDCTKGLVSALDALLCFDVWRQQLDVHGLKWTHHDIIACGRKLDGAA